MSAKSEFAMIHQEASLILLLYSNNEYENWAHNIQKIFPQDFPFINRSAFEQAQKEFENLEKQDKQELEEKVQSLIQNLQERKETTMNECKKRAEEKFYAITKLQTEDFKQEEKQSLVEIKNRKFEFQFQNFS